HARREPAMSLPEARNTPSRATDPDQEWCQVGEIMQMLNQEKIKSRYTLEIERQMFDAILSWRQRRNDDAIDSRIGK
ncbi:MAG: hypothetical protein P8Z75_12570, partial [Gammaproteobacteria bacterium]